jgi:hypothetical protein
MCEGVRYYAKLAACYDSPYRILKRVGIVAYKLKLPEGTANVSQVMVEWQGKGPEEAT